MVLAKTGPWYILQLRMLLICRLFNYNYLLCDMSRIIYTSFRLIIYNKPTYSWPEGINT